MGRTRGHNYLRRNIAALRKSRERAQSKRRIKFSLSPERSTKFKESCDVPKQPSLRRNLPGLKKYRETVQSKLKSKSSLGPERSHNFKESCDAFKQASSGRNVPALDSHLDTALSKRQIKSSLSSERSSNFKESCDAPKQPSLHHQPKGSILKKQPLQAVVSCCDTGSTCCQMKVSSNDSLSTTSKISCRSKGTTLSQILVRCAPARTPSNAAGFPSKSRSRHEVKFSDDEYLHCCEIASDCCSAKPKSEPKNCRPKSKKCGRHSQTHRKSPCPNSQPRHKSKSPCQPTCTYTRLTNKFERHYKCFDDQLKNEVQISKNEPEPVEDIDIEETIKCVLSKFCTKEAEKNVFISFDEPKRLPSAGSFASERHDDVCMYDHSAGWKVFKRGKSFTQSFKKLLNKYEL